MRAYLPRYLRTVDGGTWQGWSAFSEHSDIAKAQKHPSQSLYHHLLGVYLLCKVHVIVEAGRRGCI